MGKSNRVNRRKSHWVAENRRNYEHIRSNKFRDEYYSKIYHHDSDKPYVSVRRKWL